MTLDFNLIPNAKIFLLLRTNTPYFILPCGQGQLVGRWEGEMDGGSPVLLDLRVETPQTTQYRLGRMVQVAEHGRIGTHLLVFDPHGDQRNARARTVILTEAGNVWTLDGDPNAYVFDAAERKFHIARPYGVAHVDHDITSYALDNFHASTPLSDFHRDKAY